MAQTSETAFYQELTVFQKSVVDALKNMGFEWQYPYTYYDPKYKFGAFNISRIDNIEQLVRLIHNDGRDQKRFELKRALGSDSPSPVRVAVDKMKRKNGKL